MVSKSFQDIFGPNFFMPIKTLQAEIWFPALGKIPNGEGHIPHGKISQVDYP